jgi:hypothetical protein
MVELAKGAAAEDVIVQVPDSCATGEETGMRIGFFFAFEWGWI